MKIAHIEASVHAAPSSVPLLDRQVEDYRGGPPRPFVVCRVVTDDGLEGYGFTGRFLARQVADLLESGIWPVVAGMDPCEPEAVQRVLQQTLNPRGMTGVIASAASALDIALWDIRGQARGRSIAAMLGGARRSVPAYLTFGLPQYDRRQLVAAARLGAAQGFQMLKMIVAVDAGGWEEDARRVRAVGEAAGEDAALILDANGMFDVEAACNLADAIGDCRIAWFEEPITGNDPSALADFRKRTGMRVGAGQMEADPRIFDALLDREAVDLVQPNVLYCGGFTGAAAIAGRAAEHAVPVANGAGWPLVNMHLMAGLENGWLIEQHVAQSGIEKAVFVDPPTPVDGCIAIREKPGLGLEINIEGLRETRLAG